MTTEDELRQTLAECSGEVATQHIRADALEAEVAQLRQERDEAKAMNKEWFHAAAAQHSAHQQTSAYRTDVGWSAQAIAALVARAEKAEAARDRLRARLQQKIEQWNERSVKLNWGAIHDDDLSDEDHERWFGEADAMKACAADLLAVLTESEERKTEEGDQARVDGERRAAGLTGSTASTD